MEEDYNNTTISDPRESVKLIKNTKGYQWEIKLCPKVWTDDDMKRLEKIDKELEETYGKRE